MKWLLIPALLAVLNVQAQTTGKLPKLRMNESGFSMNFEIGDKDATKKDVLKHLEANRAATGEAYYLFQKANQQNTASWIWMTAAIIGSGLCIYGIATEGPTSSAALTGGGLFLVTATGAVIVSFQSSSNYKKSVSTYNRFAGY